MLRKDGQTDGSVTISLRNFIGEGINKWKTQISNGKTKGILPSEIKNFYLTEWRHNQKYIECLIMKNKVLVKRVICTNG